MSELTKMINVMASRGRTIAERNLRNKQRSFERYYNSTLNLHDCLVDGRPEKMIFQDHSQSNNKDLSDDKYVVCKNDVVIDVGSYVDWSDECWLVFTKETKTIQTHQQLKVKIVNEVIKWIKPDGKICNSGNGWGAYVQNQTLYTLGVSRQGNFLDLVNAKMMMYMQDNEETRSLKTGDRIFIGFGVYKIMFKDIVSRRGLINYLLEEDTVSSLDNSELRIANYYKEGVLDEEKEKEPIINDEGLDEEDIVTPEIAGQAQARIGRAYEYTVNNTTIDEWILDAVGLESIKIIESDNHKVSIRINNDARNIGSVATLYAKHRNNIGSFTIRIASKY